MPKQLNMYQLNEPVGTNCCTPCICLQANCTFEWESFMWHLHAEPLVLLSLFNLEALHGNFWRSLQYMPVELSILHSQLHAE